MCIVGLGGQGSVLPDVGGSLSGNSRPRGDFSSSRGIGTSVDNAVDPLNLRGVIGVKGIGETVGKYMCPVGKIQISIRFCET